MSTNNDDFDSGIEINRKKLSGVLGEDLEDAEVLGRAMMFTVGDVLVPHDWLVERCEELNIPTGIIPEEVWPSSAYKRAMARLLDHAGAHRLRAGGRRVELDLRRGDGNVRHLYASVFFSEEETEEEGGKYVTHKMGYFDYDGDTQSLNHHFDEDCPPALEDTWKRIVGMAQGLKSKMEDHHTGEDIRLMLYYLRTRETDDLSIISLRDGGAVYFVPEGRLSEIVDRLAQLFHEIDVMYKKGGETMAIHTLEVIDTEEKREWVRGRVEKAMEDMVDDVIDEAFEALDDDEDSTADEIARSITNGLGGTETAADQYNQLLEAKLAVKEILKERAEGLDDEKKKEAIETVLKQTDFGQYA